MFSIRVEQFIFRHFHLFCVGPKDSLLEVADLIFVVIEYFCLAAYLAGFDPDMERSPENVDEIMSALGQRYGIDDETSFDLFITDLLPLIEIADSQLTMRRYRGFAHNGVWLAKSDDA